MAKRKTLETVVKVLEGAGSALKKVDSTKPLVDRYIDAPMIYVAGNAGAVYGACELFQAMEGVPLALRVASLMAISTALTPAHRYALTPLVKYVKRIDNEQASGQKGSGILGWGKTAVLLAGMGFFGHGIYGYCHSDLKAGQTASKSTVESQGPVQSGKKDAGSAAPDAKQSPIPPMPEARQKVTEISFTKQARKTARGYAYFRYNDSLTSPMDISDAFDEWDQARGNLCRNTGDWNVRQEAERNYIVADCGDDMNGVSNGTKNGAAAKPAVPKKPGQDYTKVDYDDAKLKSGIAKGVFEKGFLGALEQMCGRLDMNAMALLNIMHHETMGTFRPGIKNKDSKATGLIQFTNQTAKTIGTTLDALAGMTKLQQLVWVERYFRHYEKGRDYSKCMTIAVTIWQPEALKHGPNKVVGDRYSKSRSKRKIYRLNSGLDEDNAGVLRLRDYAKRACNNGYRNKYR